MKIIFLAPNMNFSGGIKCIIQIANGLTEKGHDVSVYFPRFPFYNGRFNLNRLNGYITPKCKVIPYLSVKQIPSCDIMIATAWDTAEVLDRLYKERRDFKPLYFIQHIETWDYYNTGTYSEQDLLALKTYLLPYPKIVTSDWEARYVKADYKVPMGIEPVEVFPEEYWRNPYYKENPYISAILRGIPWKGDDLILELAENYPVNTFKNISNEYYNQVLWRSDIFLSASLVEGFNLPVLEAMAHGCCCITTDTGAIHEYSGCGIGVHIVDRTYDSFVEALGFLHDHPEEIRKIGLTGQKLSKKWTIQRTIDEFEKVLNDL